MSILRLLPIFSVLLFVLLQKNSIRVTKTDILTVKINFTVFAIILKDKKENNRRCGILKMLKSMPSVIKAAKYLISKSTVSVQKDLIPSTDNTSLFTSLFSFIPTRILISYIFSNSKGIYYRKSNSKSTPRTNFDFSLHFSFYHLINALLIFTYYTVKNKVKRMKKNVINE